MNYHLLRYSQTAFSSHYFMQDTKGQLYRVDKFKGQTYMYAIDDFTFAFTKNIYEPQNVTLQLALDFPMQHLEKIPFVPHVELLGVGKFHKKTICYFVQKNERIYRIDLNTNEVYEIAFCSLLNGKCATNDFLTEELAFIRLQFKQMKQPVIIIQQQSNKIVKRDTSKVFRLVGYKADSKKRNPFDSVHIYFLRDQNNLMYRLKRSYKYEYNRGGFRPVTTLHLIEDESNPFNINDISVLDIFENDSLHDALNVSLEDIPKVWFNPASPKVPKELIKAISSRVTYVHNSNKKISYSAKELAKKKETDAFLEQLYSAMAN